jgi:hypothetical protein
MCQLVCIFIICLISLIFRNVDENNLDDYDRFWGCGDKGYSRDALGIIYDEDGNYDFWENLLDTNPYWVD